MDRREEETKREDKASSRIDVGKEAAIEAEVKAARERAIIPLEIRMKQFRDMLAEKEVRASPFVFKASRCKILPYKNDFEYNGGIENQICGLSAVLHSHRSFTCVVQVSAFSTWEKELHKIVFDPRYLLLTSKERKQVQFCETTFPSLSSRDSGYCPCWSVWLARIACRRCSRRT